jgi:hypothetical protein
MPLAQIHWKHRESGETGHGQPVPSELVEAYLKTNGADLAAHYDIEVREVLDPSGAA